MERPSLILPKKRLRFSSEKMRPGIIVKLSPLNIIKKMNDQEIEKISNYMSKYPGEYFKLEYWKEALAKGLLLDSTAEALRLYWMNSQAKPEIRTEFAVRVSVDREFKPQARRLDEGSQDDLVVLNAQGLRKVFKARDLEGRFLQCGFDEKFADLVRLCGKVTKRSYGEGEVAKLLMRFAGNAKDLVFYLIDSSCKTTGKILYNDCCNLAKCKISFEDFVSVYVECNGVITAIYNYYAAYKT